MKLALAAGMVLLASSPAHGFVSARTSAQRRRTVPPRAAKPECVVFDLDGCLWSPEMYQLAWSGFGSPFTPTGDGALRAAGRSRATVELLGNVRDVMRELHCAPEWKDVTVAISSRCDEPEWARELLDKFMIDDGAGGQFALRDAFSLVEIASDDKCSHFERLSEASGIPPERMIFFDNEPGNCQSVARMGVTCAYSPEGVTSDVWQMALGEFPAADGEPVGMWW